MIIVITMGPTENESQKLFGKALTKAAKLCGSK